jgi:hypothetical protein
VTGPDGLVSPGAWPGWRTSSTPSLVLRRLLSSWLGSAAVLQQTGRCSTRMWQGMLLEPGRSRCISAAGQPMESDRLEHVIATCLCHTSTKHQSLLIRSLDTCCGFKLCSTLSTFGAVSRSLRAPTLFSQQDILCRICGSCLW